MNSAHVISRRGFAFTLIALAMATLIGRSAFAAEEGPGQRYSTIALPAGLTRAQVKEAVVTTLVGREWQLQSQGDDKVVGYLKHRSNEAIVTLMFDETKVDLYCYGWEIDKKTGVRIKPALPEGWLKNIKKDVSKRLHVPMEK